MRACNCAVSSTERSVILGLGDGMGQERAFCIREFDRGSNAVCGSDMAYTAVAGKEYEFGDLTKFVSNSVVTKTKAVLGPDYQFGDLTKNLVKGATEAASSYKFGDLSRGVMKMFQDNVVPKMVRPSLSPSLLRSSVLLVPPSPLLPP
eukprot:2062611-Rhodomonas_salina.1